jgi:hypothetical protein
MEVRPRGDHLLYLYKPYATLQTLGCGLRPSTLKQSRALSRVLRIMQMIPSVMEQVYDRLGWQNSDTLAGLGSMPSLGSLVIVVSPRPEVVTRMAHGPDQATVHVRWQPQVRPVLAGLSARPP